jgi:hypothetical protein
VFDLIKIEQTPPAHGRKLSATWHSAWLGSVIMPEADEFRQYADEFRQYAYEALRRARNYTTEKEKLALTTLIVCHHFGWGAEPVLRIQGSRPSRKGSPHGAD